ncbi:MAG: thiamine-phosphate kinase [Candidatus Bathyarchaeota archaeon]
MSLAKELGERKIIQLIVDCLDKMPNMPIPFGDDVAAIDIGDGKVIVINTDMLVGKTDVPKTMTLWQAARKAVIMNISDLAAKGIQPLGILTSIGIPPHLSKAEIHQIANGLNSGAREYDSYIVGGDTNEASDIIINCVAIGIGDKHYLIKRSGAKSGDYVAVTGSFGKTSSGMKILMNNFSATAIKKPLVESVLMPKARVKEGIVLSQSQVATASIDISDGLAWSLYELSLASNVGFKLDYIPIAPEVQTFANIHNLDPFNLALYGGEEYELLVTIKPNSWIKAVNSIEAVGGSLIKIGVVTKKKQIFLKTDEKTIPIEFHGWEHFKKD